MKRIAIGILIFACSVIHGYAQAPQDSLKPAGIYYVYDGSALPAQTPAPKGYKPFYISHFARHGARYCTSEYDKLYGWFSKAAAANKLTEEGKAFFQRYETFYQKVRYCKGNLTGVGKNQHRLIAEHMYYNYPSVFRGPTRVEAVSTESPRVIMSMWSCLSRLQDLDKDIDISADASAKYAIWLQPTLSSNPYMIKDSYRGGKAAEKALNDYVDQTVPWKEIASRFFTGPEVIQQVFETTPATFIEIFHGVVTSTRCLDEDKEYFDGLLSEEKLYQMWKGLSARYFTIFGNFEGSTSLALAYSGFTLEQIIETAEADMESGATQLRLRFGHDSGIAPLLILLGIDGYDRHTASLEESLEIFPSYNIPMGASLQLVFFRKKNCDILVKVLVNEREASLPLIPVQGPYYRWQDFKDHYLPVALEGKSRVEREIRK